ncbi:MAG: transcriptional repressor [Candidatus Omnitrophica bacterium]|nr:transcriptional repressor [Candidatus Omnitrophota bacterium]MCM8833359.1 transcriptional repressor [Candidatus Omnitrophota bacterium]
MKNENILKLLKMKNIKPSIQRVEILEYLINNRTHPSVDEIYSYLVTKIPTLSKTTVYNTLKLLCKKKILSEILIEENQVRFDFFEKQHMHFKCKKCKKIYDIYKESAVLKSKEIDGHNIEEYHIYLFGLCKECRKENV